VQAIGQSPAQPYRSCAKWFIPSEQSNVISFSGRPPTSQPNQAAVPIYLQARRNPRCHPTVPHASLLLPESARHCRCQKCSASLGSRRATPCLRTSVLAISSRLQSKGIELVRKQLTRCCCGQCLHGFQTEVTDIPTFPRLPLGSIDNGSCGLYTNLILRSQGSTFLLPRFHQFRPPDAASCLPAGQDSCSAIKRPLTTEYRPSGVIENGIRSRVFDAGCVGKCPVLRRSYLRPGEFRATTDQSDPWS
jgi:hypothetical protein